MVWSMPIEDVGPEAPAGKVLRQYWQPVAVARDLPKGGARPLRVLGEEFTLYRGESGEPFVVGSRCPHRYTWLHTGWVEEDQIRCFYHGWKFDSSGQCTEQPAESSSFADKVQIRSHPAREYAGLIFVYFGPGDPPELPEFPQFEDDQVVVRAGIRPPGVWPINYFQMLENSVDPVHTSFVHRETESHWMEVPDVSVEVTEYGMEVLTVRSGNKRQTYFHFPNLMHITVYLIPGTDIEFDHFLWHVPIDNESSMFISATVVPEHLVDRVPATMAGRIMDSEAAEDVMKGVRRPQSITEEDFVAMVGQGTVADRSNERLGRSDVGVIQLRKLWRDAIEQLEPREPGSPDPTRQDRRPQVQREGDG